MKFMLIRRADEDTEAGKLPSEDMLQTMSDYNQRMARAGVFVTGEGLRPSRDGCRIDFHNGRPEVHRGPFATPDELVAGFSIIETDSLEEAIEWACQWPTLDRDGNTRLELRRFYELEDFQPGPALESHRQLGERLARQPDQLNTHLVFNGQCREALGFYADVLGGEVEAMLPFAGTPAADEVPESFRDRIIHGAVNIRGRRLMGADMTGECYTRPAGTRIQLEYDDIASAERVFNQLAEGGTVDMPFAETFWAERFGMLTDRYGIGWMINSGTKDGDCGPPTIES